MSAHRHRYDLARKLAHANELRVQLRIVRQTPAREQLNPLVSVIVLEHGAACHAESTNRGRRVTHCAHAHHLYDKPYLMAEI